MRSSDFPRVLALAVLTLGCAACRKDAESTAPSDAPAPPPAGAVETPDTRDANEPAADEPIPLSGACARIPGEDGQFLVGNSDHGYLVALGDVGWSIDCEVSENIVFQGRAEGIVLQLYGLPARDDGRGLDRTRLEISMGAHQGLEKTLGIPKVEFTPRPIGDDGLTGICWEGPVNASGQPGHVYACTAVKGRPDGTQVGSFAFSMLEPKVWVDNQDKVRRNVELLASSFFLEHEFED